MYVRPPMADVGTAVHRLQTVRQYDNTRVAWLTQEGCTITERKEGRTGPTIPNYTWPSPDSTNQLSPTLTKHHISQKPQLYISLSTMLDKNKLSLMFLLPLHHSGME